MSRLISMEDAIRAIEDEWDECCSEYPATQIIYDTTEAIERLPIIQPKKGKWIKTARWGRVYYCVTATSAEIILTLTELMQDEEAQTSARTAVRKWR